MLPIDFSARFAALADLADELDHSVEPALQALDRAAAELNANPLLVGLAPRASRAELQVAASAKLLVAYQQAISPRTLKIDPNTPRVSASNGLPKTARATLALLLRDHPEERAAQRAERALADAVSRVLYLRGDREPPVRRGGGWAIRFWGRWEKSISGQYKRATYETARVMRALVPQILELTIDDPEAFAALTDDWETAIRAWDADHNDVATIPSVAGIRFRLFADGAEAFLPDAIAEPLQFALAAHADLDAA